MDLIKRKMLNIEDSDTTVSRFNERWHDFWINLRKIRIRRNVWDIYELIVISNCTKCFCRGTRTPLNNKAVRIWCSVCQSPISPVQINVCDPWCVCETPPSLWTTYNLAVCFHVVLFRVYNCRRKCLKLVDRQKRHRSYRIVETKTGLTTTKVQQSPLSA